MSPLLDEFCASQTFTQTLHYPQNQPCSPLSLSLCFALAPRTALLTQVAATIAPLVVSTSQGHRAAPCTRPGACCGRSGLSLSPPLCLHPWAPQTSGREDYQGRRETGKSRGREGALDVDDDGALGLVQLDATKPVARDFRLNIDVLAQHMHI